MQVEYIPFLKSKENEVHAIAELDVNILSKIVPFFDLPQKQNGGYTPDTLAGTIDRLAKKFTTHLSGVSEFYFDIYDLDDSLEIGGSHLYRYLFDQFSGLPLIPVVSIDRSDNHLGSVVDAIENKVISSKVIAFRVTIEDFESYDVVSDDIEDLLGPVFSCFEYIDLIFDCRVCTGIDAGKVSKQVDSFAKGFLSKYSVRRVVLTGSSIPASVAEVLPSNSEEYVKRNEVEIFNAAVSLGTTDYIFGDYATISPDYSDANIPGDQM
ncbi:MAG: beta family protein [Cellvibrionaceae bacterium]|nr:beta family protein [Cellvibrionaceae bacterium]